jgi:hypothetical protein
MVSIAGLLLMSSFAAADVVALSPSKDATLYEDQTGTLGNGSGAELFVGQNAGGNFARRALLAFDLTGHVPPGSQIHSAVLTLHMSRTTCGPQIVYLHKVLGSWGEGGSIADSGPGGGGGGSAARGDATWVHRFYPDRAWTQPGGDYDPAVSTASEVNDVGYYSWGPAARMTADIQQWVDNPASNFGWILIGPETAAQTSKRFDSRQHADTQYRPKLVIYFTRRAGDLPPLSGDLNRDHHVDLEDVAALAGQWLAEAPQSARTGSVAISGVGTFRFDVSRVPTLRPDIFQPGHFSAFDVLVHLDEQGLIDLAYHFDKTMDTHVIDSINGVQNWWYRAHYDGGKLIDLVTRMDLYPCKEKMEISIEPVDKARLDQIYASFTSEIARKEANDGQVIIPEVIILGKTFQKTFTDVVVRPHNLRLDTFCEGVITAMDVVLSLDDEGKLTCDLRWYDSIGAARVVRSFWLKRIDADAGTEMSGFQYETGADKSFGKANRISMPSDWRVLVSPIYLQWDWVSLE